MNLLKFAARVFIALSMVAGLAISQEVVAQDNRFLVTKDFVANYTHECHPSGCRNRGTGDVTVSFYIQNVSDGGISIFMSSRQKSAFIVNHARTSNCYGGQDFGGIPIVSGGTGLEQARRTAVYIPKGDGFYATVKKSKCRAIDFGDIPNGRIENGVVSGNVTVIKGRRILTRPISGRF